MTKKMNLSQFRWLNPPAHFQLADDKLTITTDPQTDFWQRTYYGFRHDNAPALVYPVDEVEFSFRVGTAWEPVGQYDQCGLVLYQDADNWCKASIEYENEAFSRLGSVVTNLGFSDWATTDISSTVRSMVYRLSRRGQDFLIEQSQDGQTFRQMRIFHMHLPVMPAHIGVYACSPLNASMQAVFSDFYLGDCVWEVHADQNE